MNQRWGSHWRWRLALLVVMGFLLGYGWSLADQWKARTVVAGSGRPAVLSIHRRSGIVIEAYDWKTGKRWHVIKLNNAKYGGNIAASLRAVGNGKAVAWQEGFTIHVVDLAAPHEHRRYDTRLKASPDWFVGMTDDERFAVFHTDGERVPAPNGGTEVLLQRLSGKYPAVVVHRMVDLKTGEIVDTREWDSSLAPNGTPNEFLSHCQAATPADPNEPAAALWKISSDGKWEKIEDRDPRFTKGSLLSLARLQKGPWRLLEANEVARVDEETSQAVVLKVSPAGEHVLLFDRLTPGILLMDTRSKKVHELSDSIPSIGVGEFVSDGQAILLADLRDDVRLIDLQTGKVLAVDAAGSQRRNRLVAIAVLLLLTSASFLGMAIRDRLPWAMADVLAASISSQMAVTSVLLSVAHPEMLPVVPSFRYWVLVPVCGVIGSFIGTSTMVGTYWTFGQNWLPGRWLLGTLALCASAVPVLVIFLLQFDGETDPRVIGGVTAAFGLVFAGITNAIGAFIRSLGWTIRDTPVEQSPSQYRLATFFIVVAGIAILVVVGKWLYSTPSDSQISATGIGIAAILGGTGLTGILFFNVNRRLLWGTLAIFGLVAMTSIYVHGEYPTFGAMSRYEIYLLDGPLALAAAVTIAIPCLILRARGWRWRRGHAAAKISEAVAAA